MKKIFLSFDFYGAGNIGDDLMLDGFLRGLSKDFNFYCCIPRDEAHQKKRFPNINFIKKQERYKIADQCDIWLGVGDTPIQIKSGAWFLSKLTSDAYFLSGKKINYFFLGVGAEKDSILFKDRFKDALSGVNHFWTRDSMTYDILIEEFKIDSDRVSMSSDLANISLKNIYENANLINTFKYDAGFCYYDEEMGDDDLLAVKKFILSLNSHKKRCLLFGNEVNDEGNFESALYRRMFNKLELLFNKHIKISMPDYFNAASIEELIAHYSDCKYIFTSRYHCLLTAAWAGCKVISLERSSKVSCLAEELGIIEIKKPFTTTKFYNAMKEPKSIDRNKLNEFYKRAVSSVKELEHRMLNINAKVL